MAPPGPEAIDVDDVETQEMEDSLREEAESRAGVGIVLEEEGRVSARRTAEVSVPACPATHLLSLLSVLVQTLPDSKIVEDVHNKIRNDALVSKTRKQTNSTIQTVIENSTVFESRSFRHPARVKRECFESDFWRVEGSGRNRASEDLPTSCRQIIQRWSVTRHGTLCQKRHSSEHQLRGHG